MNGMTSSRLVSPSELAEFLGVSVDTVRSWLASRRIAHFKVGRLLKIPEDEINRVLEDGYRPAFNRKASRRLEDLIKETTDSKKREP